MLSTVDALLLAEVYPAGEAPIVAADGRSLARAVRVAGKVEPVFVESVARDGATRCAAACARRRRRGHHGRRIHRRARRRARAGPAARGGGTGLEDDAHGRAPQLVDGACAARCGGTSRWRATCSWRAGGRARLLFQPADRRGSRRLPARAAAPPSRVLFVGLGSNLLVRDGGLRGTVVLTHPALMGIEIGVGPRCRAIDGNGRLRRCAGVAEPASSRASRRCTAGGGAEFLAGMPGTHRRRARDERRLLRQRDLGHRARRASRSTARARCTSRVPADYALGYRHARGVRSGAGRMVRARRTSAFAAGDRRRPRARMRELLSRRVASQPLPLPNAGSVFRNPPGDHAARLIESCGLKGYTAGARARLARSTRTSSSISGAAHAPPTSRPLIEPRARARCCAQTGIDLKPRCASWGGRVTTDRLRQGRGAAGRPVGRARDLAHDAARACSRRCARRGWTRMPSTPPSATLVELKREGFARVLHRAARPLRRGRHGAGRARGDAHPLHRQRRDGLGARDGQVAHQARLAGACGIADAALSHARRAPTDWSTLAAMLGLPLIVKPAREGSTLGLTKVTTRSPAAGRLRARGALRPRSCSPRSSSEGRNSPPRSWARTALPLIRIEAPQGNYDYQNKYFADETQYSARRPAGAAGGRDPRGAR